MFRIGDFSRLAHVSTRLLRHYDQLGLLRPAEVDPETGYRFYRAGQLSELNRILVLRELGFSLEQIGALLQESVGPEQLRAMLMLRRSEVEREVALQTERLQQLERRIAELQRGTDRDADDVLIRPLETVQYLSARVQLGGFAAAQALVATVQAELPRRVGRGRLGRLMVLQCAECFEPDALDLELGYCVERPIEDGAAFELAGQRFVARELLGAEAAAICVRVGPPEAVHAGSGAIARAIEQRGYRLSGPNRELFLKPPSPTEAPVIEMQFPVEKAATVPRDDGF